MQPIHANRQPAHAVYQRDEAGVYHAFGISVLTIAQGLVTDIITFIDPALFQRFGLPLENALFQRFGLPLENSNLMVSKLT